MQIAAQSSRIDTIAKGQETVYKADCQWETATTKAPVAEKKPETKPAEAKKPPAKAKS